MRTVKHYFRAEGDIDEVIIVRQDVPLAYVARMLDCRQDVQKCRTRMQTLAEQGVIRFGVENPEDVSAQWRAFTASLSDYKDGQACRVIYAPPAYYVQLEGRTLTQSGPGRHEATEQQRHSEQAPNLPQDRNLAQGPKPEQKNTRGLKRTM